jgi:cold shock CspA family protein
LTLAASVLAIKPSGVTALSQERGKPQRNQIQRCEFNLRNLNMIGKVTFWNQPKGFGFITVTEQKSPTEAPSQQQYFFHHSQFTKGEVPILGAFVVFSLGEAVKAGKSVQAIGVRFANAQDIATNSGVSALAKAGA